MLAGHRRQRLERKQQRVGRLRRRRVPARELKLAGAWGGGGRRSMGQSRTGQWAAAGSAILAALEKKMWSAHRACSQQQMPRGRQRPTRLAVQLLHAHAQRRQRGHHFRQDCGWEGAEKSKGWAKQAAVWFLRSQAPGPTLHPHCMLPRHRQ